MTYMKKYDFLVIGGGIAGLSYALEVAKHGTVAVLFKKGLEDSSTSLAQGGIAAVTTPEDSFEHHIEDTLITGGGLSHKNIVEIVVTEGPERVLALEEFGAGFDKEGSGFHLHREGGHSRRRIFHTADTTGYAIQKALLRQAKKDPQITFYPWANAIDIITTRKLGIEADKPNRAVGAYVLLQDRTVEEFVADKIMLATGGAGKVYLYTSNPDVATGDGIAMAYRAGCSVGNMEFFQFHPTCLYHPNAKSFLITEAMRGEGAILKRRNGEPFMAKYHPDKELAPRDVVARAIDNEIKTHGDDFVLLDITHRPAEFIKEHFPNIYQTCLTFGIDITKQPIPVVPATHYCCGGVVVDGFGCTDVDNLYAAGECAHTGLHGANRLASNSLLEGVVFGYRAAQHSVKTFERSTAPQIPAWNVGTAVDSDEEVVITQNWDEIRRFMWNYVGIVRTTKRLQRALERCKLIQKEIDEYYWKFKVTPDLLELRNLNLVASFVIRCAMARKESRGLHYTLDYPTTSDAFLSDTILKPTETVTATIKIPKAA
jgi:L-aspartate oxidase